MLLSLHFPACDLTTDPSRQTGHSSMVCCGGVSASCPASTIHSPQILSLAPGRNEHEGPNCCSWKEPAVSSWAEKQGKWMKRAQTRATARQWGLDTPLSHSVPCRTELRAQLLPTATTSQPRVRATRSAKGSSGWLPQVNTNPSSPVAPGFLVDIDLSLLQKTRSCKRSDTAFLASLNPQDEPVFPEKSPEQWELTGHSGSEGQLGEIPVSVDVWGTTLDRKGLGSRSWFSLPWKGFVERSQ